MTNSTLIRILIVTFLVAPLTTTGWADIKLLEKETWNLVEDEALVVWIERETREVILQDPAANLTRIIAGDEVKRFDEIQVGDLVRAAYWTFLRAEFREPTAEEKADPLVVVAEAGRAPLEGAPAGAVGAVIKAVVKVVAIDVNGREAAIQGPRGRIEILPVLDDAVLDRLKVGELVVLTYAEAAALSLEKIE